MRNPLFELEFILAGAAAVAVGSMSFRQPDAALKVVEELEDYMRRHEVGKITDLVGAMRI